MTGARSGFKIIYENIFGDFGRLLSAERIFYKSTTFISQKEKDGRKRKIGGTSAMQGAAKRVKNESLVHWLYLSRHIWLIYNGG